MSKSAVEKIREFADKLKKKGNNRGALLLHGVADRGEETAQIYMNMLRETNERRILSKTKETTRNKK